MIDRVTWALAFGVSAFVFWQPAATADSVQLSYRQRSQKVTFAPPGWLFGVVWTLLYGLISTNLVLYANSGVDVTHPAMYDAVFAMALVNLGISKLWLILFNSSFARGSTNSFVFLTFMTAAVLLTAIAVLVLEALSETPWWSLTFLLGPYVLWTFYATILMAQFAASAAEE